MSLNVTNIYQINNNIHSIINKTLGYCLVGVAAVIWVLLCGHGLQLSSQTFTVKRSSHIVLNINSNDLPISFT